MHMHKTSSLLHVTQCTCMAKQISQLWYPIRWIKTDYKQIISKVNILTRRRCENLSASGVRWMKQFMCNNYVNLNYSIALMHCLQKAIKLTSINAYCWSNLAKIGWKQKRNWIMISCIFIENNRGKHEHVRIVVYHRHHGMLKAI
jgi:hypothetical protein